MCWVILLTSDTSFWLLPSEVPKFLSDVCRHTITLQCFSLLNSTAASWVAKVMLIDLRIHINIHSHIPCDSHTYSLTFITAPRSPPVIYYCTRGAQCMADTACSHHAHVWHEISPTAAAAANCNHDHHYQQGDHQQQSACCYGNVHHRNVNFLHWKCLWNWREWQASPSQRIWWLGTTDTTLEWPNSFWMFFHLLRNNSTMKWQVLSILSVHTNWWNCPITKKASWPN